MKYEFKSIDADTTELSYKDKKFTIKKDIALMRDLQSINSRARTRMLMDLSKEGITSKDLTIERKENGKTYFDNSNLTEIEEQYIQEEGLEVLDRLCQRFFKMSLIELLTDAEITNNEKDGEDFTSKLVEAMVGIKTETPSKSAKKDAR